MKLNKYQMEYIAMCGATPHWRNPETKKYEAYPFPNGELDQVNSLFVEEADHFLYMDNHGMNINLATYRETEDGPLLGFLWASGSEECFFGDDYFSDRELEFQVECKTVTTYEYRRTDGEPFQR